MQDEQEKLAEPKLVVDDGSTISSDAPPDSSEDHDTVRVSYNPPAKRADDVDPDDLPLLNPGEIVARHYEVLEVLGKGGMSAVYKANHQHLNKVVAVKLLLPNRRPDARAVKRFEQEARAVSKLEHANILKVNEFGLDDDDQPYLIMDYVDGLPLSEIIKKAGPMPQERVMKLIGQMVEAIAHAHQHGIIHRDIKPSNIIVINKGGSEETVKIVDFGIAKIKGPEMEGQDLTQSGEVFGSPLYMSPEQCVGKKVDGRSDLYSLACVMYECLIGRPPFKAASHVETLMKHVQGDPPEFPKQFDPALKSFILKAMKKEVEERFQTAEEFAAGLKHWQPPAQAPPTLAELREATRPRLPLPTGRQTFAICMVLFAILLYMFTTPAKHEDRGLAQLQKEVEEYPADNDAWYRYGSALLDRKKSAEAETALRKSVGLEPKYGNAWYLLGAALDSQDKHAQAETAYRKATALSPNWPEAWYGLGLVLLNQDKFKEAETAMNKATELDPNDPDCHNALGQILEKQGRNQEAIAAFREAVRLKPNYSDVWEQLGSLLEKEGDKAGAEEAMSHVVREGSK